MNWFFKLYVKQQLLKKQTTATIKNLFNNHEGLKRKILKLIKLNKE